MSGGGGDSIGNIWKCVETELESGTVSIYKCSRTFSVYTKEKKKKPLSTKNYLPLNASGIQAKKLWFGDLWSLIKAKTRASANLL